MQENANRKVKSIRNIVFGVMYQIINLMLSFICRTFLIHKLGTSVLGINSLYTNILSLLSLAELGISNVMLVKLYKPIAEGNDELIAAYMNYYKKVYNIIALVITVVGLLFVPFLNKIVSNEIDISNKDLIVYYGIFLFNTVSGYFFVHKQLLLNAHQKFYIIKVVNAVTLITLTLVRIIFLLIVPNYKLYLLLECVINLFSNFILNIYINKKYPIVKNNSEYLNKDAKKELLGNVKDTFWYKLGIVLITNTDSIIISMVLSTTLVGYLSNYNMVITALNGIITMISSALFASIGSLAVENDAKKSNKVFNVMLSVYHYIGAFCAITMFCTFNQFIGLWLKNSKYILDLNVVIALCLNFYLVTIISPTYVFRENFGLFKKVKFYLLIASAINLVSSILLAKWLGLVGVILGTILCRLLTVVYLEPIYLYKTVFKTSSKNYFLRQLIMLLASALSAVLCYFACAWLPMGWIYFFVRVIICFTIVTTVFTLSFFKTEEFKYLLKLVKDIFAKIFKKKPSAKDFSRNEKDE